VSAGNLTAIESRDVFSVAGTVYTWGDVISAAKARGEWQEVERAAAARVAASGEPDPDTVAEAGRRFRRQRDLLAADDLEDWLASWGLTPDDWWDYVRGSLAREGGAALRALGGPPERAVAVEAICSGFLERAARRLAEDAALAAAAGERVELADLAPLGERRRAAAARPDALEREVEARRLDWTRFECDVLEVLDSNVADEAALCVRVDGQELAKVAAACGGAVTRLEVVLAEAGPELAPHLLATREEELVGPLEVNGAFALLLVRRRTPPSLEDPELRQRAEAEAVRRAVARELRTHVRWLERVV
jgi:hypothetical protein